MSEIILAKGRIRLTENGEMTRIGDYILDKRYISKTFSLICEEAGEITGPRKVTKKGNCVTVTYVDSLKKLRITQVMTYDEKCNILSRRDTLENIGKTPLVIRRYLTHSAFQCGEYEICSQRSLWGEESQSSFQTIRSGKVELATRSGRFCEGSTPYAVIRETYSDHALAFHLFPVGNYTMRFTALNTDGSASFPNLFAECGHSDDNLHLTLEPGEEFSAPEILMQILPTREIRSGVPALNAYLNKRFPSRDEKYFPVVYNTWLDRMTKLDVPRLERQLEAAKKSGCEVFVIDYGWYEDLHTFTRKDDWDECMDRAFFGKMREFSDKVRAAGLGFGFWVEMEFFTVKSDIVQKNPHWFAPSGHENIVFPKLWLKEVEDYMVDSLAQTITRYDAVYVKNDMNHSQGYDSSNLYKYMKGLARIMARLKEKLPHVTFENCSSGGLRMVPGIMLESFDNHFISDNAAPLENLRMFQNAVLRFPPGRVYHWMVASEIAVSDPLPSWDKPMMVQPKAATYYRFQSEDFDFGMLANLTGPFGFSCDLASFSDESLARFASYSAFYKKYRKNLLRAQAHLLTDIESVDKRRGYVAYQLSDPVDDIHFLYVFHSLYDGDSEKVFHAAGLSGKETYTLTQLFPEEQILMDSVKGKELMENGFVCTFPLGQHDGFRGRLLRIEKVK